MDGGNPVRKTRWTPGGFREDDLDRREVIGTQAALGAWEETLARSLQHRGWTEVATCRWEMTDDEGDVVGTATTHVDDVRMVRVPKVSEEEEQSEISSEGVN